MTAQEPHRPPMLASFVNHMIAVYDDPDHAQAAVQALMDEERFREGEIELLSGTAGQDRLDFTGERHGLLGRLRRQVQKMTDEYEHARRYEDELLRGHYLLLTQVRHEEQARRTCHLQQRHGGHFIHYYGPYIVQQFCPDPVS